MFTEVTFSQQKWCWGEFDVDQNDVNWGITA